MYPVRMPDVSGLSPILASDSLSRSVFSGVSKADVGCPGA